MLRIGRVSVPIRLLVYFSCAEAAEVSAGQGPAGQVKVSFLCLSLPQRREATLSAKMVLAPPEEAYFTADEAFERYSKVVLC